MKKWLTTLAVIGCISALVTLWPTRSPAFLETTVLTPAKPLPMVTLQSMAGNFSSRNFFGHWSVLFFGYADCPHICPKTLAVMRQVAMQVPNLHFYFITADPEHDSVERISQLLAPINPDFVGLSGSNSEIFRLARALGVYIGAKPMAGEHMSHSPSLFILNPKGEFAGLISNPIHSGNIAHDLNILFN